MLLFFELLQVAIGTRDGLSRTPKQQEWMSLLDEAQRQAIVGVMTQGLERLPKNQLPPKEFLLYWIGLSQIVETTYSSQLCRAKELTKCFQNQGYRSCVLKGIGFAQLYPIPERRLGGDIDLWVEGDRKKVMSWLRSEYQIEHDVWHNVGVQIFNDVPVEVHFHPGWVYNPFHNYRLQQWFEREKINILGEVNPNLGVSVPSVEFDAVYSLAHSFRHLIAEGVGLRHVVDYYYILYTLSADKRKDVQSLLRRFGMIKFASAMMWVLQEVCGMSSEYFLCEPNEKEGRFLLDEIMRGGNFGHYRTDNRKRNTVARMLALLPHYPQEVLWVVPWKIWHKCWRMLNR